MNFFAHKLALGGAVLAPMAGFTDAPFRRLCREYGSAWAVTEMVSARALALGDERGITIGAPYDGEPDLVIQLFAARPDEAAVAADLLARRYRPAAFDLNMGCPVKKVVHKGCGVQLMGTPGLAADILRAIREATGLPVSAKMRLGRDGLQVHEAARAVVEAGASAVAVHGRTGEQKYTGQADWAPIVELAEALDVPVLGSGDVTDAAGFRERAEAGVGVMIARGALGRPWIFAEVRGERPPAWPEAVRVILRHARDQVALYGEGRGMRALRGQLAKYAAHRGTADGLPARLVRVETLDELSALLSDTLGERAEDGFAAAGPRSGVPEAVPGTEGSRAIMPRSPVPTGAGGPLV